MVEAVEDTYEDKLPEIQKIYLSAPNVPEETLGADPFAATGEKIKNISGTTPVFKRRIANEMKKVRVGSDGETGSKQIEVDEVSGYNAFGAVTPPYNLDYLAKLYEVSAPHYAAVNAKVANIVGLGYQFVETSKTKRLLDQMDDKERVIRSRKRLATARDELTDLWESLNKEDTFTETMVKVWRDYETTGNGYLEIGRKKDGTIGYLGHCPSTSIRIRKRRDGFVQIISNKAVFFRNFGDGNRQREDFKTKPPVPNPFGGDQNANELIHFKKYSPTSGFYGVPDIIAAKQQVAGNEFSARFNLDYFENKAVPRHVIILKGAKLAQSQEMNLLQFFETGLKGRNHRSLFIPLPPDSPDGKVELKIEPVEAGIQDSSFGKYEKSSNAGILMAHRVPITKVSVAEGVALAVARDADKTFKEQVCAPEQKIAAKKVNGVVKELSDAFEIELAETTLTDADTQSKIDERDIKNQLMTPNEKRAMRGLPGLAGGDKVVELKPQQAADATANRQRDAARSAGATDSAGEARNPKGEGRTTP